MEHRKWDILLVLLLYSAGEDTGELPEYFSFVLTSGNIDIYSVKFTFIRIYANIDIITF